MYIFGMAHLPTKQIWENKTLFYKLIKQYHYICYMNKKITYAYLKKVRVPMFFSVFLRYSIF